MGGIGSGGLGGDTGGYGLSFPGYWAPGWNGGYGMSAPGPWGEPYGMGAPGYAPRDYYGY
ncbi:hypothetical protein KEU06_18460 [Pseudaminobacter sp. 19-2017]|uniref:Uncharacterized protein n=1 Tax=Pseudaminobacter soli (ex Zhang et al. 2022) TaxID=2831468 RepID=A0A942I3N4_9HYPH|nr:hypothetical protein [Pseudaminobacter soli]MBS3650598.1 hypothetical protein [Pseudaminobacter soli]